MGNNVINYAEKFEKELLESFIDKSYIAPFITTNVEWLDAKTFHFTSMKMKGYKNHSLNGGWNRQSLVQEDHPYTVTQDRDVEFFVDKKDVDESNTTASAQNISTQFEEQQSTPEKDAYFFSKVVAEAEKVPGLKTDTAVGTYTADNIYGKIVEFIGRLRRYRNKGLIIYLRPVLMDLLALSKQLTHTMESTTISTGGKAIQTRITNVDGVPIVEVIDDDRFHSKFDFTDGYAPARGSFAINMLGATPLSTKMVPKISSIYMFAPGQHTSGDGYLYQNRANYDTFVFPNGATSVVDSVAVDLDTEAKV